MPVSLLGTLLFFALGLVLIVKGGDLFVDAAVWITEASGVPQFIIGATVVSLATTLPELMVSSLGVLRGEVDLAVGNAVGSVTANTGLIMGLSILCLPAVIRRREFAAKGALLLAAALALALLCRDERLTAGSGLALLAIFVAFGWENLRAAGRSGAGRTAAGAKGQLGGQLVKFLLGVSGIVWGADLLIEHGADLALALGVPAGIVGVTVVAVGTSLPELVTTLTAIVKGESSLSIGNIVGANIIDLTLILPVCALLSGGELAVSPRSAALDLPVCFALTALGVLPPLASGRFRRWQGAAMLAGYGAYVWALVR